METVRIVVLAVALALTGIVVPASAVEDANADVIGASTDYIRTSGDDDLPDPTTRPQVTTTPTEGPTGDNELPDRTARARTIGSDVCPFPAEPFPDVPSGNVHEETIHCLSIWIWEITEGFADGTYRPAGNVTRGQLASFMARFLEANDVNLPSGSDAFNDDDGHAHEANINALAELDVVQGFIDGAFRPAQAVTRAQMAAFIQRALQQVATLEPNGNYFDDDDGHAHEEAINAIATYLITTGISGRSYAPSARVKRDQVASFLVRSLDMLIDNELLEPPEVPPAVPPRGTSPDLRL